MQHSNASNAEVKRLLYLRGGKKKKKRDGQLSQAHNILDLRIIN